MTSFHLVTAILVMMTSCVGIFATADGQSKASEKQHMLSQQPQQQQQQAKTEVNSKQQEGFIDRSVPISQDFVSLTARNRPQLIGKRLSRSFSNQWYPISQRSEGRGNMDGNVDDSVHSVSKRAIRPRMVGKRLATLSPLHSVAKRAIRPRMVGKRLARLGPRRAPWFIGKRDVDFDDKSDFDDDMEDEWTGNVVDGDFLGIDDKGPYPDFIAKRDSYFEGFDDDEIEKREMPRFIGMRTDRSPRRPVFVGRRNSRRPVFVGKRSIRMPRRPVFVGKRLTDFANDELFLGNNQLYDGMNDKRGRPKFVGRRSQESNIGDNVEQIIRNAELRALRARITKEKRKYGPRFVGKRDEMEEESTR